MRASYPDAIDALERSIESNRENVYAYIALGDAFERQGEEKKALACYRELESLGIGVKGLREKIDGIEKDIR